MHYSELSSSLKAAYAAQCRTLVRALTTIEASISFSKLDCPAQMRFEEHSGRAIVAIDERMPTEAIAGLVIHESGHVLATDAKAFATIAKKCEQESAAYINIVEDQRINIGVIGRHFPWAVQYLDETNAILRAIAPHATEMPSEIVNAIFHKALVHDTDCDPEMLRDAQDYVTQWNPTIVSAPTTGDLEAAALALQALDKKHGKLQKPQKPTEQEQERQEQVYGCASDEVAKKEAEARAKGAAAGQPAEGEGEGKAPKKPSKKRTKASPYSAAGDEREFRLRPADNQAEGFSKAVAMLSGMRNRLHDAVMSDDTGAPQRHMKRGQLDCRRVAYATSTGSVFVAPHADRRKVNTAIDVVIDCSGSMDHCSREDGVNRAHLAAATAYMLGAALARVDGAQVGVLLYDDGVKRHANIAPMRGVTRDKAALWANAGGGTNTNRALDCSVRDLLASRTVRRRISLIITDDEAADDANIAAAQRLGIEAYCLCIDSSKDSSERVKRCKDASALPGIVAELVKAMLVEGR